MNLLPILMFSLVATAFAGEEPKLVQDELVKSQVQFQQKLATHLKQIRDLEFQRKTAVSTAQTQSTVDQTGIGAMKKYRQLLAGRYVKESGDFEPGLEVTVADVGNINKLFITYLHTTPLAGKTSAGQAARALEWGVNRLEEVAKEHAKPTETNNSDLQIISKKVRDAEVQIKTLKDVAKRMGVNLVVPDTKNLDDDPEDLNTLANTNDE